MGIGPSRLATGRLSGEPNRFLAENPLWLPTGQRTLSLHRGIERCRYYGKNPLVSRSPVRPGWADAALLRRMLAENRGGVRTGSSQPPGGRGDKLRIF